MVSGLATWNKRPLEPKASLLIKNKEAGTGMQKKKKKKTKKQGATGVPEERRPTKTSSGSPVNVPAILINKCLNRRSVSARYSVKRLMHLPQSSEKLFC